MKAALAENSPTSSLDLLWAPYRPELLKKAKNHPGTSTDLHGIAYDSPGEILPPYVKRKAGVGQSIYIGQYSDAATGLSYLNA